MLSCTAINRHQGGADATSANRSIGASHQHTPALFRHQSRRAAMAVFKARQRHKSKRPGLDGMARGAICPIGIGYNRSAQLVMLCAIKFAASIISETVGNRLESKPRRPA